MEDSSMHSTHAHNKKIKNTQKDRKFHDMTGIKF